MPEFPAHRYEAHLKHLNHGNNTLGWTRGGGVARKNRRDADTATANADLTSPGSKTRV
jgi:hypothetical protein